MERHPLAFRTRPTKETDRMNKVEIYRDKDGKHRWRVVCHSNGEIVGASSQGFHDADEARKNIGRLQRAFSEYSV